MDEADLEILDIPQCDPVKTRIIHVGMGAAGLLTAHKARKMLKNYELVCYEKNDAVGGTWYENRYPGCACDVPAHLYCFPFYPNPNWSSYYAYAPDIEQYFKRFYEDKQLSPFVVFDTEVITADWRDEEGLWHVQLRRKDGTTFEDTCNVLINGSGVLSKWKWPEIEGLHDFQGKLAHSAAWPKDLTDWSGKRVAVIGSGSSSVQIVPEIAKTASQLSVFIRNKTFIVEQFGATITNKEADPEAADPAAPGKHHYTEKELQRFRDDPQHFLDYRRRMEKSFANGLDLFLRDSGTSKWFENWTHETMRARLNHRQDLIDNLIPSWIPGCRRLTPGEGYLEALTQPNVHCIFDGITRITPTSLETITNQHIEVDILICATGFNVQYTPHFVVTGQHGTILQQTDGSKCPEFYASISVPGFPNFFTINGPRGNWAQGCALPSHEVQVEYALKCVRKMQEDRIKSMTPKWEVTRQLNRYEDVWHDKLSVWAQECKSWYKDGQPKGRVHVWPGTLGHHLKFMKHPRYEHYDIVYRDEGNVFAFLGNGKTISQAREGLEASVPYIRNDEDEEWEIE